jgi:hypothetical protein
VCGGGVGGGACVHWMNLNIGGIVDNILICLYVNLLMKVVHQLCL